MVVYSSLNVYNASDGKGKMEYIQFQEREVRIAVICLSLALLCNVFLKNAGGLWVVSIEAIEDGVDVLRPVRAVVEGVDHDYGSERVYVGLAREIDRRSLRRRM